jgi:hypothetical protein
LWPQPLDLSVSANPNRNTPAAGAGHQNIAAVLQEVERLGGPRVL